MLSLYRRHLKQSCSHTSRKHRQCKCPLWIDGTLGRREVRRALGLTSWEAGQRLVREIEIAGDLSPLDESQDDIPTITEAVERFFADASDRNLAPATIAKYHVVLRRQLAPFCEERGYTKLSHLTVQVARDFRGTWKDEALAASKKLERLRSFFKFCHASKWIDENPARKVTMPKVNQKPTLPFTTEEVDSIVSACDRYSIKGIYGKGTRDRVRAFVLVLRYTGLRIGDVIRLKRENVKDGKVFLYTQKTGTPVWVPVPPVVISALSRVPNIGQRFFWSGEGKLKSAVADWQRTLRKLFKLAGVEGGYAHRFRDTFAVELLLAGVDIEDVAVLLGHSDSSITKKHYSPWVRARQERLERAVMATWRKTQCELINLPMTS